MKRVLAVLLCLLCAMLLLVACGDNNTDTDNQGNNNTDNQEHTHTYKTNEDWSKDAQGHWYDATCECEDAPITKLNHTDANNDGACDVCTFTNHEHEYTEDWTADCTNHWNAADCGHTVAGINVGAHVDEDADGRCDVCNYIIEDIHEHIYATEWTYGDGYHWHAALCEHKVEVADKAACNVNAAGVCTVCDAKIKEIDKTDILAVLNAAIANNHKVVSGSVVYENNIPDINYTLSHSVYYVLGEASSYEKRIEYGIAKERWYQLISADEVFGVTSEDGGFSIIPISADADSLKGYNYFPSTMLGSYDSTATLAETLWAIYDISLKNTVTNKVATYNAETGVYTISYTYLEVTIHTGHDNMQDSGNDDSTAELQTVVSTSLYEVEATFTVDKNFVIDSAEFVVGAYNQDIDGDYVYDVETGTYTMSPNALADTYSYKVAQTSGKRTYYTAYPKASIVPNSFDLTLPDGEIAGEEIKTAVGTYVQFALSNLKPFSALAEFIDPSDFTITVIDNATNEPATFEPFYSSFSGAVCFNPNKVGSYTMTIKYGELEKVYTLTITPAAPNSVKLYPFGWIAGFGEMVYTADENNPGSATKIELGVGETIDFLVRVNPAKADQLYTITVDSDNASITNVTLENVVAFYEMLEECAAYQFKSDVEGKYVITLTSKVDENVTSTVEVYVGNVEQDVKTSETFEIATPGNWAKSDEYVFTAGVAGTYVITAENFDSSTWIQLYDAANDSWTKLNGSLPYSVELAAGETATIRLYGWSADTSVVGKIVTVTVAKEASQNSASYEIATPGNWAKSDEYVFTAEANGTYVITAENFDSSTWIQLYDAVNDSWTKLNDSLPYSVELAAGETATIRLYGWSDEVAGQMVTVTVAPNTASDDDGGTTTTLEGSGTDSDPFILVDNGDYVCAYPGGYNYIYYKYTATQTGILTISVAGNDFYWGMGSSPMQLIAGNSNSTQSVDVTAGESVYIGLSTDSANAANMNFTVTFEAGSDDDGGNTEATPDGSESNPFSLVMGENELLYQGYAYAYAFYVYTATEAGNLTITATSADYDLAYGPAPMYMTGFQASPMVRPLAAGETIYIGISTETGAASSTPITFTASFEAASAGLTEDELKASLSGMYEFSDTMGLLFMFADYESENGVYFMNAYAPDYSWDLYFTYTLTNNNDGTFTITPTYYSRPDYETAATQENIDAVLNTVIVANYNGESWSFGEQADEPSNTPLPEGATQINAENVTYEYVAETAGTLNLAAGNAIMGMVEISYTVNGGDSTVLELGTNVDLALQAGDVVVITVVAEGYSSIQATWTGASVGGNTALNIGANQIETEDVTFEYTAETAGTLNLSAGNAIMGMVEISYTVNGGDSTVLELGTNVDLALQAGDVVVITVVAEGYSSIQATWTEASTGSNTALNIGANQIETEDVTFEYTAETAGTLNLAAGNAIMGMVEISYTVNGGDSTILELGTNVDLALQAGDVVVITVVAEGYSSIQATWTEA